MKIAQPNRFRAKITRVIRPSRPHSAGCRACAIALVLTVSADNSGILLGMLTGRVDRCTSSREGLAGPTFLRGFGLAWMRTQATGLIPLRGFTVAGQCRILTGFAA